VKASGLRWISLMLLVKISWAKRIWALPFLTVWAASERYYESRPRQHKKITDWARQLGMQVRRWLPKRKVILVADSSYAALELLPSLLSLSNPVYMVTRCVWMRPCTSPHHLQNLARSDDPARKANDCRS
jgi:hypothetical protein